jgi:SAM-dependent methyltransferase
LTGEFGHLTVAASYFLTVTTENRMATDQSLSPQRILEMTWGFAPPLILEAAIRNRVFDVLDQGPCTLEELVIKTSANPRGLRALCNALVGLNFLANDGSKYSLTPESAAFLVSTKPAYQGGLLKHISQQLMATWLHLADIVMTGKSPRHVDSQGEGSAFFVELVENIFNMSAGAAMALGESISARLNKTTRVLDIAAGSGVWGIMLAKNRPTVNITAIDWPAVIPVTKRVATRHGVAGQLTCIEGDLNSVDFGNGYGIATLGHILHSEGPAKSQKLLKKVYDALTPGGTIAIAEFIPNDDRKGPSMPLIFAVNMLVNTTDGDTFTMKEISGWLTAAGFKDIRTLAAPGPSPLVLADKPA